MVRLGECLGWAYNDHCTLGNVLNPLKKVQGRMERRLASLPVEAGIDNLGIAADDAAFLPRSSRLLGIFL